MSRSGPRGPQQNPRQKLPMAARFWARVDQAGADECWMWIGARDPHGYGRIGKPGREGSMLAHRLSWELEHGPIPMGLSVCHHCDTPSCVNPRHLFIGTQTDNMRDCMAKGRGRGQWRPGERSGVWAF